MKYGASRFDLSYETSSTRGFIEVKGVTLEEKGSPFSGRSHRAGAKHLQELATAVRWL